MKFTKTQVLVLSLIGLLVVTSLVSYSGLLSKKPVFFAGSGLPDCADSDSDWYCVCTSSDGIPTCNLPGAKQCGDCDDSEFNVNPEVNENSQATCTDSIDNDCDNSIDCSDISCTAAVDSDGDGYIPSSATFCATTDAAWADCDDSNSAIHPNAAEVCTDNKDNDCDGNTDCADTSDCPDGTAAGVVSSSVSSSPNGICCSGASIDTQSNAAHCGGCPGTACTSPTPYCYMGNCDASSCGGTYNWPSFSSLPSSQQQTLATAFLQNICGIDLGGASVDVSISISPPGGQVTLTFPLGTIP